MERQLNWVFRLPEKLSLIPPPKALTLSTLQCHGEHMWKQKLIAIVVAAIPFTLGMAGMFWTRRVQEYLLQAHSEGIQRWNWSDYSHWISARWNFFFIKFLALLFLGFAVLLVYSAFASGETKLPRL